MEVIIEAISRSERKEIYLGNVDTRHEYPKPDPKEVFTGRAHDPNLYERFKRSPAVRKLILGWGERRVLSLYNKYVGELAMYHAKAEVKRPFSVVVGDFRGSTSAPAFVKSRGIGLEGYSVLMPLDSDRHFHPVNAVSKLDVPFSQKSSRLVWRGATSGSFDRRSPGSRFLLVDKILKGEVSARLDLGLSKITPKAQRAFRDDELDAALRPALSKAEQLQCKYLLSLEGNDVATGLKWMLASSSVVIMPRPTVESWLCESRLVPGVHYVEVRHDLSNLEEVYDWCETNQGQCIDITRQANQFVATMMRDLQDETLAVEIVKEFHRRVQRAN